MFGISYGELFLLIGATAALIGPKDLPIIARAAGRIVGRSIGYVRLARGQFDNIMQQNQVHQMHKELQDSIARIEAIRHELRASFMNPGPLTRRLVDSLDQTTTSSGNIELQNRETDNRSTETEPEALAKSCSSTSTTSGFFDMHSQATAYAKLAESAPMNSGCIENNEVMNAFTEESGLTVLPVSAESAGLLPGCKDDAKGSDVVLVAILEAEVARNAKEFFSQDHDELKIQ